MQLQSSMLLVRATANAKALFVEGGMVQPAIDWASLVAARVHNKKAPVVCVCPRAHTRTAVFRACECTIFYVHVCSMCGG